MDGEGAAQDELNSNQQLATFKPDYTPPPSPPPPTLRVAFPGACINVGDYFSHPCLLNTDLIQVGSDYLWF